MTQGGLAIGSGVALLLVANGVYVWWAILGCMVVGALIGMGIDFNLAQTREATERLQPHCPSCHGKLPEWSVSKCLHCGTDVDLTPQVAAIKAKQAEAAAERAAIAAQREAQDVGKYVAAGWRAFWRGLGSALVWVASALVWVVRMAAAVDSGLRRAIGEENTILYRFAQVALYIVVPIAVAVLTCILYIR
jgi:hypothetical protein